MKSPRAEVTVVVLLVLGVLGIGGWGLSKTKWFSKESKRAETNQKTTEELIAAKDQQGAAAAAYVTTLGEVAATLPESREKDYIGRAGGIALSFLPKPDPQKIIEAQKLKLAVLSGQLELANQLNGDALNRAAEAEQRAVRALAAKRASDDAISEAAAKALGAEQQSFWLMLLAGALFALWAWTKLTHASPLVISRAVQDIRSGTGEPNASIAALDGALTPFQQTNVAAMHWLRTKITKVTS